MFFVPLENIEVRHAISVKSFINAFVARIHVIITIATFRVRIFPIFIRAENDIQCVRCQRKSESFIACECVK